jgi:hypothetical protein
LFFKQMECIKDAHLAYICDRSSVCLINHLH